MSPTTDVHAHVLVPAAEALVADEPELGAARAARRGRPARRRRSSPAALLEPAYTRATAKMRRNGNQVEPSGRGG